MLIVMPSEETMKAALDLVCTTSDEQRRLAPRILAMAGQEYYPEGVNLGLEHAIYDYTKDQPIIVRAAMNMKAEKIIRAITPDAASADAVLAAWEQTH